MNSILCNNCFYAGICPDVEEDISLENHLCGSYLDYEEFYEEEYSSYWIEMSYRRYSDKNCLETEFE